MKRHPLDPWSLLFGVLFSGTGCWVLLTGADTTVFDPRWVWPVVLSTAGAALLAPVLSSRRVDHSEGGDEGDPMSGIGPG